jgi:uncharacterized protein (TIGR03435 family)
VLTIRRISLLTVLLAAEALAQPPLRFEVASVKPSQPGPGVIRASKVDTPVRTTYRDLSLRHLILDEAFGLTEYQLNGPAWLAMDWFDIDVRKPPGTTAEQARLMMRTLLADRFHLVAHFEDKRMPAYVLSAGNGRKKLQTAAAEERQSGCPAGTMDDYARIVQKFLRKPVVNETGITGQFRLRFVVMTSLHAESGTGQAAPPPPPPPPNLAHCPGWTSSDMPAAASSAETAVREQMGLSLRQAQNVNVHMLVIDRIDRNATPN